MLQLCLTRREGAGHPELGRLDQRHEKVTAGVSVGWGDGLSPCLGLPVESAACPAPPAPPDLPRAHLPGWGCSTALVPYSLSFTMTALLRTPSCFSALCSLEEKFLPSGLLGKPQRGPVACSRVSNCPITLWLLTSPAHALSGPGQRQPPTCVLQIGARGRVSALGAHLVLKALFS